MATLTTTQRLRLLQLQIRLLGWDNKIQKSNPNHDERGRFYGGINIAVPSGMSRWEMRLDTVEKLTGKLGVKIINKKYGTVAQISKHNIKKITSSAAIVKSIANGFTEAEHFALANNIDKIFEKSIFACSKADERGTSDNVEIERYDCDDIRLSTGKIARARVTIKWIKNIGGRRIYTIEGMSFHKKTYDKTSES